MSKTRNLSLIIILALLAACSTTPERLRVVRIDPTERPAKPGAIAVIQPGQSVYREYRDMTLYQAHREIALLSFQGGLADESAAITEFQNQARQLGADAIIIRPIERISSPFGDRYTFHAAAVVFEKGSK